MFDLNDDQALFKVTRYQFESKGELIRINVHHVIAGKSKYEFIAIPTRPITIKPVETKYWGFGDSENAALKDCLNKIKDVPYKVIFPPRHSE